LFVPQIGDKANEGLNKLLEKFGKIKHKGMSTNQNKLTLYSSNVSEL